MEQYYKVLQRNGVAEGTTVARLSVFGNGWGMQLEKLSKS